MVDAGTISQLPFAGGTAGQEALTPGEPQLGQLIKPPKLVQGQPPQSEEEFNQLFVQAKQYLERADVRAFLLQAGVQMLQPRPPGVPFVSQVGQAIGAGSQAALGVQTREQEQERFERKEARAERGLDLEGRRVDILEKGEERQLKHGERRLDILSEANSIARLRAAAAVQGNALALKKFEETKRQFDADLALRGRQIEVNANRWAADRLSRERSQDKTFDRALVAESMRAEAQRAQQAHKQLLEELKQRELTKEGSKERKAIDENIRRLSRESVFDMNNAETHLERLRRLGGAPVGGGEPSERGGTVGTPVGTTGAGPGIGDRPPAARAVPTMTATDLSVIRREGNSERALEKIRRGEINASQEQITALEKDVKKKTEKRRAELPEGPESVDFERLEQRAQRPSSRSLPGSVTGTQNVVNALTVNKQTVRSPEEYSSLEAKDQKKIQTSLNVLFPKDKPPRDAQVWQAVLYYPLLQNYLRGRYGRKRAEELIEQARKNFREGAEARTNIRMRREEQRRREREALSGR